MITEKHNLACRVIFKAISKTGSLGSCVVSIGSQFSKSKEACLQAPRALVNFAAKLVHTRRALSSNVINFHQEPVSGQACNPPDPH